MCLTDSLTFWQKPSVPQVAWGCIFIRNSSSSPALDVYLQRLSPVFSTNPSWRPAAALSKINRCFRIARRGAPVSKPSFQVLPGRTPQIRPCFKPVIEIAELS